MLTLNKAINAVTCEVFDGITQISAIADITVVAYIYKDSADNKCVNLVVLYMDHHSECVVCQYEEYAAAVELFQFGDDSTERTNELYPLAEKAQPSHDKFRWIP